MDCNGDCLIGLDLGTSSIKGILLSSEGDVLARETSVNSYLYEGDGRIEMDAEDLFQRAVAVIRSLVGALPADCEVKGIGMASASGNTLLVDKAGVPMVPALSWMDTRGDGEMVEVLGTLKPAEIYERVGWPLIDMFPLAHLSWLRKHRPTLLDQADRVCMTTDYLYHRLTGRWGIDSSTATTFYLQDQAAGQWHAPYLEALGIPEFKLPPIHASGSVLGGITEEASRLTGLRTGTLAVLGAFDHPCAARGAGVLMEGRMLLSCGTSWVGFYPVANRKAALDLGLLADPFLQPEGPWGAMFSFGEIATKVDRLICTWISDDVDRYQEFDRLAMLATPGASGLLLNPMQDDADHLRGYARLDIARGIMEGTAFLLKMRMDSVARGMRPTQSVTMVGGPSETCPWPQIVCDVLGLPVDTVYGSCAGAAGAAILAGIGTGIYFDAHEAQRRLKPERTQRVPDPDLHGFYENLGIRFRHEFPSA